MMAVFLAGKHIGNMHFYHRSSNSPNRICYGDGCVSVSSGIEDNSVDGESYFVQFIDNFAFHIGLKIAELYFAEFSFQFVEKTFKILFSIQRRLSFTE